jgi:hypothetical protein
MRRALNPSLSAPTAVRKNRYVILPIDFEDAWKVCLSLFGFYLTWVEFLSAHASQQQTVKRSDETHEFCKISYPSFRPFHPNRPLQTDEGVITVASSK